MSEKSEKQVIGYVRVSSKVQDETMQVQAIERWGRDNGQPITIYKDKWTGKSMDRPGWRKVEAALRTGKVHTLLVHKVDRIGRQSVGVLQLFEELKARRVKFLSLSENFDPETALGKAVLTILAAFAELDNEMRGERIREGQAIARNKGKTWGGSTPGQVLIGTDKARAIAELHKAGQSKAAIAKALSLSWPTVHKYVKGQEAKQGR